MVSDLQNRFEYHPPHTPQREQAHQDIRSECLDLAEFMNHELPDGREKSLVLTKIEEAMFWANAAIARQP